MRRSQIHIRSSPSPLSLPLFTPATSLLWTTYCIRLISLPLHSPSCNVPSMQPWKVTFPKQQLGHICQIPSLAPRCPNPIHTALQDPSSWGHSCCPSLTGEPPTMGLRPNRKAARCRGPGHGCRAAQPASSPPPAVHLVCSQVSQLWWFSVFIYKMLLGGWSENIM